MTVCESASFFGGKCEITVNSAKKCTKHVSVEDRTLKHLSTSKYDLHTTSDPYKTNYHLKIVIKALRRIPRYVVCVCVFSTWICVFACVNVNLYIIIQVSFEDDDVLLRTCQWLRGGILLSCTAHLPKEKDVVVTAGSIYTFSGWIHHYWGYIFNIMKAQCMYYVYIII